MAEALYGKMTGGGASAMSAGTQLSGPEQTIGELLPHTREVLDVMMEEGLDISSRRRKQLTEDMAADADRIIALLEDSEALPPYLAESDKVTRWNVPDPKGKDLAFTRRVKDTIKDLIY